VVEDFTILPDLAPTFIEAAGLEPPRVMTARSLIKVLVSKSAGLVDPSRDAAIVGRERHVAAARTGDLPYPQRAIRTKDFLYIRNFKPDRLPMGTGPGPDSSGGPNPTYEQLREDTFAAYGDMDASPTKAWIFTHRNDPGMDGYFDFAFGPLPAEELYDIRKDPHGMHNLADDPGYAAERKHLSERLMSVLRETGDPRVSGDGTTFDKPPYAGPLPERGK
jgi:uncharacterized sulfatase